MHYVFAGIRWLRWTWRYKRTVPWSVAKYIPLNQTLTKDDIEWARQLASESEWR